MRDVNTSDSGKSLRAIRTQQSTESTNSSTCRRKANKKQIDCLREWPRGSALAHFHLRVHGVGQSWRPCGGWKSTSRAVASWSLSHPPQHPQGIRLQLVLEKVELHGNTSKKCRGFCAQPDYKSSVDGGINTFRHAKNLPPLHLFIGSYYSMCFSQTREWTKK